MFDPDTFAQCDGLQTSGAESLNRRFAASRNHIRYLAGDNLVPFIYAKTVFLNLRTRARQNFDTEDIEDIDVNALFDEIVPCRCVRCLAREKNEEEKV